MKLFKKRKYIYRGKVLLLIRWNIFECRWFSIKIHKLISSDSGCQHDHPWAFFTFLMKGGYVEYSTKGVYTDHPDPLNPDYTYSTKEVSKVYSRFSLLYRPATYIHRLEIHQPVWTLVLTLKKERVWGFFTATGWKEWFKFDDGIEQC